MPLREAASVSNRAAGRIESEGDNLLVATPRDRHGLSSNTEARCDEATSARSKTVAMAAAVRAAALVARDLHEGQVQRGDVKAR